MPLTVKSARRTLAQNRDIYRRVKIACARREITVKQAISEAFEEWLKKNEEEGD